MAPCDMISVRVLQGCTYGQGPFEVTDLLSNAYWMLRLPGILVLSMVGDLSYFFVLCFFRLYLDYTPNP
jgi:hypothetical protein